MAYSNKGKGLNISNLRDLYTYQLMLIGRTGSNILFVDEQRSQAGQNPTDSFALSIKTLDDFLFPIWDEKYKDDRSKAMLKHAASDQAHELLQAAMSLIQRKGVLAYVTWMDADDIHEEDDEEIPEGEEL